MALDARDEPLLPHTSRLSQSILQVPQSSQRGTENSDNTTLLQSSGDFKTIGATVNKE